MKAFCEYTDLKDSQVNTNFDHGDLRKLSVPGHRSVRARGFAVGEFPGVCDLCPTGILPAPRVGGLQPL